MTCVCVNKTGLTRQYLKNTGQLLQHVLISGFHALQILGFNKLLLDARASCLLHHLKELLLLYGPGQMVNMLCL